MTPQANPGAASPSERAKKILDKADEVLAHVDSGHIFSVAKKTLREFPKFDAAEIESGPLLGTGGFSGVREALKILDNASESKESSPTEEEENLLQQGGVVSGPHEEHYEVESAREFMAKHCLRFGSARYCIKRLKSELNEVERARGALDLAIEIKYLSVIWHPNISEFVFVDTALGLRRTILITRGVLH